AGLSTLNAMPSTPNVIKSSIISFCSPAVPFGGRRNRTSTPNSFLAFVQPASTIVQNSAGLLVTKPIFIFFPPVGAAVRPQPMATTERATSNAKYENQRMPVNSSSAAAARNGFTNRRLLFMLCHPPLEDTLYVRRNKRVHGIRA